MMRQPSVDGYRLNPTVGKSPDNVLRHWQAQCFCSGKPALGSKSKTVAKGVAHGTVQTTTSQVAFHLIAPSSDRRKKLKQRNFAAFDAI